VTEPRRNPQPPSAAASSDSGRLGAAGESGDGAGLRVSASLPPAP